MISDVLVATVYTNKLKAEFCNCVSDREEYDLPGVALNSGSNVLSVATPNGQAAFLFLLTSGGSTSAYTHMVRTYGLDICS